MQAPVKKIYITQVFGANPAAYAKFGLKGLLYQIFIKSLAVRTNGDRVAKYTFWDKPLSKRNTIDQTNTVHTISNVSRVFIKYPPTSLTASIFDNFSSFVGSFVQFANLDIYFAKRTTYIKRLVKSLPLTIEFSCHPMLPVVTLASLTNKPFGTVPVFKRVLYLIVFFSPRQLIASIRAVLNSTTSGLNRVYSFFRDLFRAEITFLHNTDYRQTATKGQHAVSS